MLGYFPDPYPDELLYSLCARFSDVMRYPAKDGAFRELFGVKEMGTLATLPTGLDRLVTLLPPRARYTTQRLIEEHTLFPYYAPFLPPERALALQKAMKGRALTNTLALAGISAHHTPLPQWLRYCPKCVEADRRTFGSVIGIVSIKSLGWSFVLFTASFSKIVLLAPMHRSPLARLPLKPPSRLASRGVRLRNPPIRPSSHLRSHMAPASHQHGLRLACGKRHGNAMVFSSTRAANCTAGLLANCWVIGDHSSVLST